MLFSANIYVVILCLTAVISSCVALTAWIRRDVTLSTQPFIWLMVAIAGYVAAAAGSETARSAEHLIAWSTLEYVASCSVITLYLTFALYFTGSQHWITQRRRILLWLIPLFNIGLVITNDLHGLVWKDFTIHPDNPHLNIIHHGYGYYWIAAFFYIYVVTGSALVVRAALLSSCLYRKQATAVVIGSLPPILAGTLFTLGISPENANILPMSFLATGIIYFASLFSFRLFDLRPIARDTLIESMNDGVLVINHEHRILDLNPAARRFVPSVAACIGQKVEQALHDWEDIVHHCYTANNLTSHIIERAQPACYIEMRVTYLHNRRQEITGKLIVLRDITENHQNQLQLEQVNGELTHQLTRIQKLRDQLKEQAIRDSLTGLFNRRYFEETLPAELLKAERAKTTLSVVLMDIDYFKKVNDTYGHLAGDQALRQFAQLLQQHIRKSDIACRYGGEEFILAMPNMPLTEAYQRADEIRRALQEITIDFDNQRFNITTSMGIDAYPDFPGSQHELLKRVDQALYAAKANGRNRIEVANQKTAIISKLSELERAIASSRTGAFHRK